MKLEEATKEELVWWIKEHSFELSRAMGSFPLISYFTVASSITPRQRRQVRAIPRLWNNTATCWLHTRASPCLRSLGRSLRRGLNWSEL